MSTLKIILVLHVISGFTSLFTGPVAMISKKGGKTHNLWGMIYTYAMTGVFITALLIQPFKFTPFLFMIAFLSYYSVFSGVRFTRLKKLHVDQRPKWYDWFALILNGLVNIAFIAYGMYSITEQGNAVGYLAVVFGIVGLGISINNLKPYVKKPKHQMYWWIYHMGNMMGGYVATTTAFSTTVSGMLNIESALSWLWPLIIGLPLSQLWQKRYEKKFKMA